MGALAIAVVVPVGEGEAPPPEIFFDRVRGDPSATPPPLLIAAAHEGISSSVREVFAKAGARLRLSPAPRGQRLREAAASSPSEDILLFLHGDTLLGSGWQTEVRAAVARGAVGGAFRLGFAGGGAPMAWVAGWANLRTFVTKVPYGDQAPFVRRDVYERLGGHAAWPFLEDWDFSRRLVASEGRARVALLSARVETSPRRYLERGVAKTVLTNWSILKKARKGQTPEQLAALYRS